MPLILPKNLPRKITSCSPELDAYVVEIEKCIDRCGDAYPRPKSSGYAEMRMLKEFNGRLIDDVYLSALMAIEPRKLRITFGEETTDHSPGRVTIRLNDNKTIRETVKSVSVGFWCGHEFDQRYKNTFGRLP